MDRVIRRAFRGHTEMRLLFGELSGKIGGYQGWCRIIRDRGRGELNGRRRSLPRFWTRIDRKIFLLNVSFKEERKIIGTIRF